MTLKTLLIVFTGSGIGGICRYVLSQAVTSSIAQKPASLSIFPVGTLAVNFIGCFLMGILLAKVGVEGKYSPLYLALGTGLLGGFTTASAFSGDALSLIQQKQMGLAGLYIFGTVVLCLVGVAAGFAIAGGTKA